MVLSARSVLFRPPKKTSKKTLPRSSAIIWCDVFDEAADSSRVCLTILIIPVYRPPEIFAALPAPPACRWASDIVPERLAGPTAPQASSRVGDVEDRQRSPWRRSAPLHTAWFRACSRASSAVAITPGTICSTPATLRPPDFPDFSGRRLRSPAGRVPRRAGGGDLAELRRGSPSC